RASGKAGARASTARRTSALAWRHSWGGPRAGSTPSWTPTISASSAASASARGRESMTVSNWNGSACCAPAEIVAPRDVDELVDVVTNTYLYPSPLRPVGALHSLHECFTTTGTDVLMHQLDAVGDTVSGTVTVTAI